MGLNNRIQRVMVTTVLEKGNKMEEYTQLTAFSNMLNNFQKDIDEIDATILRLQKQKMTLALNMGDSARKIVNILHEQEKKEKK